MRPRFAAHAIRRHLVRAATTKCVSEGNLSFSFSGSGWLAPFHLGVISRFREAKEGFITDKTIFAGTSGGSLAALMGCSDMPSETALSTMSALSTNKEFNKDINAGLKKYLLPLLPSDVLERCNDRLHVTVTRVWPPKKGNLNVIVVNRFDSVDHLLDCVAASCFIPGYSARSMTTGIVGCPDEHFIDGGVFAFIPPMGNVRVAVFPRQYVPAMLFGPCHICPDPADFPMLKV